MQGVKIVRGKLIIRLEKEKGKDRKFQNKGYVTRVLTNINDKWSVFAYIIHLKALKKDQVYNIIRRLPIHRKFKVRAIMLYDRFIQYKR